MSPLVATVGETLHAFTQAAGQFFKTLGQLQPLPLLIGLTFFALYLLFRSRAIFNAVRAAYPRSKIPWRRVWGAYVAAYGLNGVVPAGGGNIVQLVLTKTSIEESNYATVTAALAAGVAFDSVVAAGLLIFAFGSGEFPQLSHFGGLESFDISFFASNANFTIFLVTAIVVGGLTAFAFLSRRIANLWGEVRQGWAIFGDRRRYVTHMMVPQACAWVCRGAAYYELLRAFHISATVENAVLVLAVQVIAAIIPFTPGGAGVQQALLLVIFASTAPTDAVAVFSVGQQIAIVILTLLMGLAAIVLIFKYRSFRDVMRAVRRRRAFDRAAEASVSGGDEPF